jgi:hypothetical protein
MELHIAGLSKTYPNGTRALGVGMAEDRSA